MERPRLRSANSQTIRRLTPATFLFRITLTSTRMFGKVHRPPPRLGPLIHHMCLVATTSDSISVRSLLIKGNPFKRPALPPIKFSSITSRRSSMSNCRLRLEPTRDHRRLDNSFNHLMGPTTTITTTTRHHRAIILLPCCVTRRFSDRSRVKASNSSSSSSIIL